MGQTNQNYAAGHAACAKGEPLYLGIEGWTKERSDFADGWLACLEESAKSYTAA